MSDVRYPNITVKLIGRDGNAFSIMGAVIAAFRKAGVSSDIIKEYQTEAMSGDYDNLLRVTMQWIDVE